MIQAISQLVVLASLSTVAPVDGLQLETFAQEGYFQPLPIAAYQQQYASLPLARTVDRSPVKVDVNSLGIVTTAPSTIVMDVATGDVLYAKQPDQLRTIGSVTKLMTALVFLEQEPDLSQVVQMGSEDIVYGGRIYLALNDDIPLEDVFAASLVGSDNSATEMLMKSSGLTEEEFIHRMNEKALELGMVSTHFSDVTGLDPKNMSTARDLTQLLFAAESNGKIKQYTTSSEVTVQHASGRTVTIENTNGVLDSYLNTGDFSVEVGKTGYLPQAGYVLATMMKEQQHDIFVVVLGSDSKESRVAEVKGLADWAFRTFSWPEER